MSSAQRYLRQMPNVYSNMVWTVAICRATWGPRKFEPIAQGTSKTQSICIEGWTTSKPVGRI